MVCDLKGGNNLLKGIRLLQKVKEKARAGVGKHEVGSCPIHCAYGIRASSRWDNLLIDEQYLMLKKGWSKEVYESFIKWYDLGFDTSTRVLESREAELREYLK